MDHSFIPPPIPEGEIQSRKTTLPPIPEGEIQSKKFTPPSLPTNKQSAPDETMAAKKIVPPPPLTNEKDAPSEEIIAAKKFVPPPIPTIPKPQERDFNAEGVSGGPLPGTAKKNRSVIILSALAAVVVLGIVVYPLLRSNFATKEEEWTKYRGSDAVVVTPDGMEEPEFTAPLYDFSLIQMYENEDTSSLNLDIVGHYTDDWGFPVSLTFYPTGDRVWDFRIVGLKMMEEPTDGIYFEADSVLLDVGTLEPGQGVVAEVCFMDSPIRGISFADRNGKHVYALGESGEDGSLIIYDQGIRQDSFLYEGQDQAPLKVFFAGCEPFNMETVASYDSGEEQWIGDLIFTTFGQISDFNIVSLNWYNIETGQEEDQCEDRWDWEENHYCTIGEQLLHVDSISQGQAVSVKMNVKNPFDDILPTWGVTYTDAAGVKHAEAYAGSGGNHEYALIISNYDIHPKDAGQ